jgi:putative flippase GtrA
MSASVPAARRGPLATFGRHQVGAVVATAIDFATMSALVSGLGVPAALATAIGDPVGGQAWRYVFVSGASLGWNAGGEYVLHDLLGLHYLLARVVIASIVSVCWNFPVQRAFVYRQTAAAAHGQVSPSGAP